MVEIVLFFSDFESFPNQICRVDRSILTYLIRKTLKITTKVFIQI